MKAILLRVANAAKKEMIDDSKFAIQAAEALGITVESMPYTDVTVTVAGAGEKKVMIRGEWTDCPEVVLFGAFKERYNYQVNAIMRMFESLGALCINCVGAMEKANDKLYSMQIAKKVVPGIRLPKTMLVTKDTTVEEIGAQIGFPVVIKILDGAMGKGVVLMNTEKELEHLLDIVFAAPFGDQILAQEAILSSVGRDLRIMTIGDEVIDTFVRSNENSFRSNVKQGGTRIPFEVPQKLKEDAIKIVKAMDIKCGSVDFMFGENEGEFFLCEVNAMPGLTSLVEAKRSKDEELIGRTMAAMKKLLTSHSL